MNSRRHLVKRLLRLFPVKIMQEYFEEDSNQTDAIENISGNFSIDRIHNFVLDSFWYTRHYIYMYERPGRWQTSWEENMPFKIEERKIIGTDRFLLCLPAITYNVVLTEPLESTTLTFLQPTIIHIADTHIAIHITKVERTVSRDFPAERRPTKVGQINKEEDIKEAFQNFFSQELNCSLLDINQGVKFLWQNDYIDSARVQARDSNSVTRTTMDGEFLFKEIYPEKFAEIMAKPLMKTHFKYIFGDESICDHFEADASNGEINIPIFAKNENQVRNVIAQILNNN